MWIMQAIILIMGAMLVLATCFSATRTFVLPRSAADPLAGILFRSIRYIFVFIARRQTSYEGLDRVMAFYAPVSLLLLLPYWLTLVLIGFMGIFWATGISSWADAFTVSGSSLLTLGFARGDTAVHTALSFIEATIGLILVALLIAYLPTMYNAFSQRERAITLLEVRAGSPPSAEEMIARLHRIGRFDHLHELWETWETWFAELSESHTSLAALVFFRSPQPQHSWLTASGTILDAAALVLSSIEAPWDAQAALCLRAGYLALRHIADFFRVPYNPHPSHPTDPISISREEFEAVLDRLAGQGVPLKSDRDAMWQDFAGWRVNYDTVLLALSALIMAPYAPWSSDRSLRQSPVKS